MVKAIAVMNFNTLSIPTGSSSSSLNLTYLSNLIQQFVVFFPFLQGAQIATHSSCQGNSAECPLECVCCLQCVWALPGAEYTQAPLLLLPHTTFSSVYPLRSPQDAPTAEKTHTYQLSVMAEVTLVVPSVCVCGDCVSGDMSKSTLLLVPSCLSRLCLVLTCMPTYSPLLTLPRPLLTMSAHWWAHTLLGSWRHTSSCGRLPTHACSYSWSENILIGC